MRISAVISVESCSAFAASLSDASVRESWLSITFLKRFTAFRNWSASKSLNVCRISDCARLSMGVHIAVSAAKGTAAAKRSNPSAWL